jgi:hypothetical protein
MAVNRRRSKNAKVSSSPSGSRVLPLAKARAQLPSVVKMVAESTEIVGVSVHGTVTACIMSERTLRGLKAKLSAYQSKERLRQYPKVRGSLVISGDLREASREASAQLQDSGRKSARELAR